MHKHNKNWDYKGVKCIYCKKSIIRITEHIRNCLKKILNNKKPKNLIFKTKRIKESKEIILVKDNNRGTKLSNILFSVKLLEINDDYFQEVENVCYYDNYIIGSGRIMKVYFGIHKEKKIEVAIKIDRNNKRKSSTINESIILTTLKWIAQIPFFYDYCYINNN